MHDVVEILGWIIAGSLVVLVVMNASNAASVIKASSGAVTSESKILTGSGYNGG